MNFTEQTLKTFLENILKVGSTKTYSHASNLLKQLNKGEHLDFLLQCANKYYEYHTNFDMRDVEKSVEHWNNYLSFVRSNNHFYTAQSKFEPTILEESISRMFVNLATDVIKIGSTKAFSNMYFCPNDYETFQQESKIKINTKDQDFAIYKKVKISVSDGNASEAYVPVVAMECKTYLDKTMLEGSIATADKIKSGNPYCRFCIVTESYEVDYNVDIKHSRIDQIYVLRKGKDRKKQDTKIEVDVVKKIYDDTIEHLKVKWTDVENNIKQNGIVF
jgi:hypothetical protein